MNLNSTAESVVLHVGGLHWATTAHGVEQTLLNRPGVLGVEANAVPQTATVTFDPARTDVAPLALPRVTLPNSTVSAKSLCFIRNVTATPDTHTAI